MQRKSPNARTASGRRRSIRMEVASGSCGSAQLARGCRRRGEDLTAAQPAVRSPADPAGCAPAAPGLWPVWAWSCSVISLVWSGRCGDVTFCASGLDGAVRSVTDHLQRRNGRVGPQTGNWAPRATICSRYYSLPILLGGSMPVGCSRQTYINDEEAVDIDHCIVRTERGQVNASILHQGGSSPRSKTQRLRSSCKATIAWALMPKFPRAFRATCICGEFWKFGRRVQQKIRCSGLGVRPPPTGDGRQWQAASAGAMRRALTML